MTDTGNPILAYGIYATCPEIYVSDDLVRGRQNSDQQYWVELYDKHNLTNCKNLVGDKLKFLRPNFSPSITRRLAFTIFGGDAVGLSSGTHESFCVLCNCKLMLNRLVISGVICKDCGDLCFETEHVANSSLYLLRPEMRGISVIDPAYKDYVYYAYEAADIKGEPL